MFTAIITRNGKTTTREFADGLQAWEWANACAWGGATARVVRFFGTPWERDA